MGVRVSTRACPIFVQGEEAGCVSLWVERCVKEYWLGIDFLVKGGVVIVATTVLNDK